MGHFTGSPWVTIWFPFKCLIKYQYATSGEARYFILSLSIAVNTSHFTAQSNGFVLRKIWHQGLFESGQREGVLAWMVTKYICLALCSAPPQGHRATSPTEPTATTDGQSPEGFKDFIWCEISPSSATRGWGNTSCKVREFRSFTQENLKALTFKARLN